MFYMTDCPHVVLELSDEYPMGTMACKQCGAIVPPEDAYRGGR